MALTNEPTQEIEVESRRATISLIVEPPEGNKVRVVVQGFLKNRFLGSMVAIDGFYKHRNGDVSPMADKEFYDYD